MERMIPLAMLVGAMFLIVAFLIFEHLDRFNPHDNNEQQNFDFGFSYQNFTYQGDNRFISNEEYISQNSVALKELEKLNGKYKDIFYDVQHSHEYGEKFKSRGAYDRADFYELLINYTRKNLFSLEDELDKIRKNILNFKNYENEYRYILNTLSFEEKRTTEIIEDRFIQYEKRCLQAKKIAPICSLNVVVRKYYVSEKGNSSKFDYRNFDQNAVCNAIEEISNRDDRRSAKNEERAKMTPGLRYDVMKRDNFKCVICGASREDGVKLHVDHIKPVSKGGKTEMSNLRTLCQDCNLGKHDKYDPNGCN